MMLLLVLSIREIGPNLRDEEKDLVRKHLSHISEKDYKHDIQFVPGWIRDIFIKL